MVMPLMRAVLIAGASTSLLACSQHGIQSGSADTRPGPAAGRRARLCIAEGRPGPLNPADPESGMWAITVSSEGGACAHVRQWRGGGAQVAYEVIDPPRHGRITQEAVDGNTVVSYWPEQGYVGSDRFALRYPATNTALPYLVGVVR